MKRAIGIILVICMLSTLCSCSFNRDNDEDKTKDASEYKAAMENAQTTPYGKYPELITYTLGKLASKDNSNMPEGDTYENNAYTRYLREKLNIQNDNVFEEMAYNYDSSVNMAIATGKIPDIMAVSSLEDVILLAEQGLIEDLTQSYETCASDRIKEIYASYGDILLDMVTIDGKIMAVPETNIAEGPNLIWLRKDWMDKLGLNAPTTMQDVEDIVRKFITLDPGNNGEGNTIGLACDTGLCGESGYSSEYLTDIIFACYNAFPKQWIENKDGEIVYGSVQSEAKDALAYLNKLYNEKIIDNGFLLRTSNNIIDLVTSGRCGSFFGPWWAPNNPLNVAMSMNEEADWQPYLISTNADGTTSYHTQNPGYKYVVVRKGFEHPELIWKMISVIFDDLRYESESEEITKYFQNNVDPTARPVSINVDYNDALTRCYDSLKSTLEGKSKAEDLLLLESAYYESCVSYLNSTKPATIDEWSAYVSRITACSLISSDKVIEVESLFFGTTSTMNTSWWKLKELENKAYLKIVTGEEPIEYFDTFVERWHKQGGQKIVEEVREKLNE